MSYWAASDLNKWFGFTTLNTIRVRLRAKRLKKRERSEPMWLWRMKFNKRCSTGDSGNG